MNKLRVVFMGTPDFAVPSLNILVENGYDVVGVITVPDKPAGRGQQIQESAVKKYALSKGLTLLQPDKLKAAEFLQQLKTLNADIQVVVAFRMLPEAVWNMPRLGTINLHGSLLPQYRGAAPINWAIINGEKETGVTTFLLQHEIDTGQIIYNHTVGISETDTAGSIHDTLMEVGANLVLKTIQAIEKNNYPQIDQEQLLVGDLKIAPKIFKEDCKIDWNNSSENIYNKVRGLSPYPTAFSTIKNEKGILNFKIFGCTKEETAHTNTPGTIDTDNKTYFKVATNNGYIQLNDIQLEGKKRMPIADFLRGFSINAHTHFI
jgi:methionyl-tRNA formyltransferase